MVPTRWLAFANCSFEQRDCTIKIREEDAFRLGFQRLREWHPGYYSLKELRIAMAGSLIVRRRTRKN